MEQSKRGYATNYDRTCIGISSDESNDRAANGDSYVVRLKTPTEYPEYTDLVYGIVGWRKGPHRGVLDPSGFEDPILLKTDGSPTYHLASVVDDHYMRITHVIRGVEWMPSTPKHLHLYRAFDWDPPAFAHVGLLQDTDRQKLSKRDHRTDLNTLKKDGFIAEAIMNSVALLGWSHPLRSDILSPQELIDNFSLKFTKGNAVVNYAKLLYLQGHHFRRILAQGGDRFEDLVDQVLMLKEKQEMKPIHPEMLAGRTEREFVTTLLRIEASTITLNSASLFLERNGCFVSGEISSPSKIISLWKEQGLQNVLPIADAAQRLEDVPPTQWTVKALRHQLAVTVDDSAKRDDAAGGHGEVLRDKKSLHPSLLLWLRSALLGGQTGPSIFIVMEVLGRHFTLNKLYAAQTAWSEEHGSRPDTATENM